MQKYGIKSLVKNNAAKTDTTKVIPKMFGESVDNSAERSTDEITRMLMKVLLQQD